MIINNTDNIKVEIVADSINQKDIRITTYVLEYPRFVHAELLTHRVFSKNSASSRAIPFEKFVKQITDNPAMPVFWGKNQSGMQAKEELTNGEFYEITGIRGIGTSPLYTNKGKLDVAKMIWLEARDSAIAYAKFLNDELGLHKQIVNRILEPWFRIRIILTGTEFENFFALRHHADAQPEIKELAQKMLDVYNANEPKSLHTGDWHTPFSDKIDEDKIRELLKTGDIAQADMSEIKIKIAIARCARVSYFNFEGKDDYVADVKLCDRLFLNTPKHLSPTEHVAFNMNDTNTYGNFIGWKQYRKFFPDENLSDPRVIKKHWKSPFS